MSSPAPDPVGTVRYRLPRIAGAAVERARLTVVPRTRVVRAPRVPFVLLVSGVLLAGVVGLLMFNTSMQQASFTMTTLEERAANLQAREQTLAAEIEELRDPQRLAVEARKLGMRTPPAPAFLHADGSISGKPVPAAPVDGERILPRVDPLPRVLDPAPVVVRATPPPEGTLAGGTGARSADSGADTASASAAGASGRDRTAKNDRTDHR